MGLSSRDWAFTIVWVSGICLISGLSHQSYRLNKNSFQSLSQRLSLILAIIVVCIYLPYHTYGQNAQWDSTNILINDPKYIDIKITADGVEKSADFAGWSVLLTLRFLSIIATNGAIFDECGITNWWQSCIVFFIPPLIRFYSDDPNENENENEKTMKLRSQTRINALWELMRMTLSALFCVALAYSVIYYDRNYGGFETNLNWFVRSELNWIYFAFHIGGQSSFWGVLIALIFGSQVTVRYPYNLIYFKLTPSDFWSNHSLHMKSALMKTIYIPFVKRFGSTTVMRLMAAISVFVFNFGMHCLISLLWRGELLAYYWVMTFVLFSSPALLQLVSDAMIKSIAKGLKWKNNIFWTTLYYGFWFTVMHITVPMAGPYFVPKGLPYYIGDVTWFYTL